MNVTSEPDEQTPSDSTTSSSATSNSTADGASKGDVSSTSEKDKSGADPGKTNDSSTGSSSTKPDSSEEDAPGPAPTCKDAQKNGSESDVDCGGPDCTGCSVGQMCGTANDCRSLNCESGKCAKAVVTCESNADCHDKNPCTRDICGPQKRCENTAVPNGQRCNDANACTHSDRCDQGQCAGTDTRVFHEDFSEPPHAFLNGSASEFRHWEIGPAVESTCAAKGFVDDPAQDHTQDGRNGVMGVHIGGCQTASQDNIEDCAWSDLIDVTGFDSDVIFSYWRHLSSPGINPTSRFIPMVTNKIYYRVPGAKSAVLIESGWPKAVNDEEWTYIEHRIPSTGLEKVSFGICYKRLGSTGGYPGWSVDDVRVRQFGCEMGALKP